MKKNGRGHWRIGVLTCSTLGARGLRKDESGQIAMDLCRRWWNASIEAYGVLPDNRPKIARCLRSWSRRLDLILTTGGTGLSPTDVTPEATRDVIDRESPGLAEAMRLAGSRQTPLAWLSRGVAGLRGKTLIVNLPGSPKAVKENLNALKKLLPHALQISSGLHRGSHRARKPGH